MSFDYSADKGRYDLPGFHADREAYKIFAKGKPSVSFDNVKVDGAKSKEALLHKLAQAAQQHTRIQFNFAGHGVNLVSQTFVGDEMRKRNCVSGIPAPPRQHAFTDQLALRTRGPVYIPDDPPASMKACPGIEAVTNQFALAPPKCMECMNGCPGDCKRVCGAGGKDCKVVCEAGNAQSCISNCGKNYCITKDELAKVFRGKKVFGILDACHSGGVEGIDLPHSQFMTGTANAAQKAGDSKDGGVVGAEILKPARGSSYCSLDKNRDGKVDAKEMLAGRHKTTGQNNFETPTIFGDDGSNCFISLKEENCAHQGTGVNGDRDDSGDGRR